MFSQRLIERVTFVPRCSELRCVNIGCDGKFRPSINCLAAYHSYLVSEMLHIFQILAGFKIHIFWTKDTVLYLVELIER